VPYASAAGTTRRLKKGVSSAKLGLGVGIGIDCVFDEFALTLGGGLISMPMPESMSIPIANQRFFLVGGSSGYASQSFILRVAMALWHYLCGGFSQEFLDNLGSAPKIDV
jgi:hypothetical protein